MRATLTDENITDILDAAGYGIGYWASKATVDERARTYTVWPQGGLDEVVDNMPAAKILSFQELENAFNLCLENEPKLIGRWVHRYFLLAYADRGVNGIDAGHIDADAADALVQVAMFGEVVFG